MAADVSSDFLSINTAKPPVAPTNNEKVSAMSDGGVKYSSYSKQAIGARARLVNSQTIWKCFGGKNCHQRIFRSSTRLKRVEDLLQTKNHKWFVLDRAGKKSEKSPADRAGHRASRAKGEMFEVDIGIV